MPPMRRGRPVLSSSSEELSSNVGGHSRLARDDAESSPRANVEFSESDDPEVDELYRLKFNAVVKPYKNAQARSGLSLGLIDSNVSSIEGLKKDLFALAVQHVVGIAVCAGQGFAMREEPLEEKDLDLVISFKHRNHFYALDSKNGDEFCNLNALLGFLDISQAVLRNWTSKDHTVDLHIYKYGANVQTSANFQRFQASVLEPAQVDRAGAASNDIVAEITSQLKNHWNTTYASQNINWHIWANSISMEPSFRHEALILEPPPQNIIHLFQRSPTNDSHILSALRSDNQTAIVVMDDIEQQLDSVGRDFLQRLEGIRQNIRRHRQTARAMCIALHPDERPDSVAISDEIPNIPDMDHQ